MDMLQPENEILAIAAILSPAHIGDWIDKRLVAGCVWERKASEKETKQDGKSTKAQSQPAELFATGGSAGSLLSDYRPTGKIISQPGMLPFPLAELSMMSQRSKITDPTHLNPFRHKDYEGISQNIYTADFPLNVNHPEFGHRYSSPKIGMAFQQSRNIYGSYFGNMRKPGRDWERGKNHGNCAVSKAVGLRTGIAQKSNLKLVPTLDGGRTITWALASWETMIREMRRDKNNLKKQGKVFVPVVFFNNGFSQYGAVVIALVRKYIRAMVRLNAFIAIAAGNFNPASRGGKSRPVVDHWPALFAAEKEFEANMLIVGSTKLSGELSDFSMGGPLVKISAPGETFNRRKDHVLGVWCADGEDNEFVVTAGTSFTAPVVAAMAAYYLSIHPHLRDSKFGGQLVAEHLLKTAITHCVNCPLVVYNGLDGKR
ncbi:hypothetical protein NUU61_006214 [Penicillium alfredii]|uniref:Peptidase S8/S53 domain-containing protein n=1 Tax=Penicillium alfredii TaxID=1506179 RepID=A0A9W9F0J8_9EURO|nr:uncharacterized protein NUU61_006214 [Penicillium alfredii]KAJ5091344.1 hypothetical protein NUU61_006214 [Penicillium alfredii]